MSELSSILSVLPLMSLKDIRALQVAIDNELDKHADIDKDLFNLVFTVVNERPIAINRFSSGPNGAIWRKNVPAFTDLVKKLTGDETLKRPVLFALHKFLLEILVEDIKAQHLPLTLRQVCLSLAHIESAFEKSFPDYLKGGLKYMILDRIKGRT